MLPRSVGTGGTRGGCVLALTLFAAVASSGVASAAVSDAAAPSPPANAVAGATFTLVHPYNPTIGVTEWGVMTADGRRAVYASEAEARRNAPSWTVYRWDGQNTLTVNLTGDLSRCLTVIGADTAPVSASASGPACNVAPNATTTWRLEQGNLRSASSSQPGFLTSEPATDRSSTTGRFEVGPRNVRFDTLPADPSAPEPPVDNGGVIAQAGGTTSLDRTGPAAVQIGTRAVAEYTSVQQEVRVVAPTGTSWAQDSRVRGAYARADGQIVFNDSLDLADVRVAGATLTGSFRSPPGFTQGVGHQLAWFPRLTVDDAATEGLRSVAFTVSGTTNLGAVDVSGKTPVVVPAPSPAPLVIQSPADGSTVDTDSNQVEFRGTGEPGARVQLLTQTATPRPIVNTVVDGTGHWKQVGGNLAFGVDYVLNTVYTPAPGATPVTGEHRVRLKDSNASVVQPFQFLTPPDKSEVVAPNKQVRLAGVGTTGTQVEVWNYASKDRSLGTAVVDGTGAWEIPAADVNNQNTKYELHVEYTLPGQAAVPLTHTITVQARQAEARH